MGEHITTVSGSSFDETIKSATEPVLVDFWATWCGPCLRLAPILEEIATDKAGELQIAKLNVDESPDIARRFDVMSIPTLILFKDGLPVKRFVGLQGKRILLEGIAEFL